MSKTTEVIISEESIDSYNRLITQMASSLETHLNSYCEILSAVAKDALISGDTHSQVENFATYVKELKRSFDTVANQVKRTNNQFVRQVDADDQYLY